MLDYYINALKNIDSSSKNNSQQQQSWGSDNREKTKVNELGYDDKLSLIDEDTLFIGEFDVLPIGIDYEVHLDFIDMMNEVPEKEWCVMLDVEDEVVTDYYTPEQNGKSSTVNVLDHDNCTDYDGFMHSHHTMGLDFSGCDEQGVNSNYDYSLTIAWDNRDNNSVNYAGSRRFVTDDKIITARCGVQVITPDSDAGDTLSEKWSNGSQNWGKKNGNTVSKKVSNQSQKKHSSNLRTLNDREKEILKMYRNNDIFVPTWIVSTSQSDKELVGLIKRHCMKQDGSFYNPRG